MQDMPKRGSTSRYYSHTLVLLKYKEKLLLKVLPLPVRPWGALYRPTTHLLTSPTHPPTHSTFTLLLSYYVLLLSRHIFRLLKLPARACLTLLECRAISFIFTWVKIKNFTTPCPGPVGRAGKSFARVAHPLIGVLLKGARINKADCHVPSQFFSPNLYGAAGLKQRRRFRRAITAVLSARTREGEREPTRKTAKQTRVGHVFN
jgi:hypothetical protein